MWLHSRQSLKILIDYDTGGSFLDLDVNFKADMG